MKAVITAVTSSEDSAMKSASINQPIDNLLFERRLRNIKRFGSQTMSYSALQQGIREFRHQSFKGFVPYMSVWGVDYVLSNPVAPVSHYATAIQEFRRNHPNAVYCQVDATMARLLQANDFKVNAFGVEHWLNLKDFRINWKERRGIKRFVSRLSNLGYSVFEHPDFQSQTFEISREWLETKQNSREFRFLARPYAYDLGRATRTFYLIHKRKLVGFCAWDPIYTNEDSDEPTRYVMQHLRLKSNAPSGAGDFLLANCLMCLRDEGVEYASLGLAPLYMRSNDFDGYSKFAERVFEIMYATQRFYHFKNVGEHKDRYQTIKQQTYVATSGFFSPRKLAGLLKVNNLI